jgi:hypothetical protein
MAAIVPLLILIPIVAAAGGYATWGVTGAVLGGLGGLVAALAVGGWPLVLLLKAEQRKQDAKEAEWSHWMAAKSQGRRSDTE